MSRILLLLIIVVWMSRAVTQPAPDISATSLQGSILFIGGFVLVVLSAGLWSRLIARTVHGFNLHQSLRRFHTSLLLARLMIPVWFGLGVFVLGWGTLVDQLLGPMSNWPIELPGMLVGTLPAFAAWMGLWWAQFPADRALREQNLLIQINDDAPIHPPQDLRSYFISNLRLQLLFTVVPVALILFLHDVASLLFWFTAGVDLNRSTASGWAGGLEFAAHALSVILVLLFVPEVLRRVLDTQPLPGSALRDRLEGLCLQTGLKYREILLWRTDFNMGNAAVMGMIPQSRYILLSDVLLERMNERQIEAVFAHEVGHVKHWHMSWYVVLFVTLALSFVAFGQALGSVFERMPVQHWIDRDLLDALMQLASVCGFLLVFGLLSRSFERQADVYAARTMQGGDLSMPAPSAGPLSTHVGPYGADIFISALHRVAVVNNIPVETQRWRGRGLRAMITGAFDWLVDLANNFFHGSIATRMAYLRSLSEDPRRTTQFDRRMMGVRMVLVAGLLISATWTVVLSMRPDANPADAFSARERRTPARLTHYRRSAQPRPELVSPAAAAIPGAAESAP